LPNNASGADGLKIAVYRKDRASLVFTRAAAHRKGLSSFTLHSKMINNIYLRILVGGNAIGIGLLLLMTYFNRDKDNLWGSFYRLGEETNKFHSWKLRGGKIFLALGWFSVLSGLMVLLFGFRKSIGY